MSLRITARPESGIRRVGVHHPPEPTVYEDSYFTLAEIEILRHDPDLIVEALEDGFLTPAERRLQLVDDRDGDGSAADAERSKARHDRDAERSRSGEAQPGDGHALSPTPSHGLSAEQSAAEGEGLSGIPADTEGASHPCPTCGDECVCPDFTTSQGSACSHLCTIERESMAAPSAGYPAATNRKKGGRK